MSLPADYLEKTYAGVLGKIIGVYIGRPFEGWTYERITSELGPIWYYVNEKLGKPLIVPDDDITGTFTFIRALDDYDLGTRDGDRWSESIGKTWLNYIVEKKSILWWGGIGRSSEHTAYARLAAGIPAPRSGSIAENGAIIAEQIGAQIFIDGWGMVSPGDPERAAWFAGQAGRVSHDGESVYAAQVIAALEAAAYTEPDMAQMLETAFRQIPSDSLIRRLADELRNQRARGDRWENGYQLLHDSYGYDKFKGGCHVVPNHGLILMTLLYAPDSLQNALMIVNTAGWDTDCNSANVGCIMGIHLGLSGFDTGPDYRGPVRDQVYLPTADGSGCISDATIEAYKMANRGRIFVGEEPLVPKDGARFHFELAGSTQGFRAVRGPDWTGNVSIGNAAGHSAGGKRSLRVDFTGVGLGQGVAAATETFVPAKVFESSGYAVTACPILYSGQTVTSRVELEGTKDGELAVSLIAFAYDSSEEIIAHRSSPAVIVSGGDAILTWSIPDTNGYPILKIGVEARVSGDETPGKMTPYASVLSPEPRYITSGSLFVDFLRIDGIPDVELSPPSDRPWTHWLRQWVNGVTSVEDGSAVCRLLQDSGTGLFYTGSREWCAYKVSAEIIPHFFNEGGVSFYVQGMKHYLSAVVRRDGTAAIVEMWDELIELASAPANFKWEEPLVIEAWVTDGTAYAVIGGVRLSGKIRNRRLNAGGAGIVLTVGSAGLSRFHVSVPRIS